MSKVWWYFGPMLLAVVLFLLVGTVCERRIEDAIRRVIERRQAMFPIEPPVEYADIACSTTVLGAPESSNLPPSLSQRTLGTCRTDFLSDDFKHELVQT